LATLPPLPTAAANSATAKAPLRVAGVAVPLAAATVAMAKPGTMPVQPALGTLAVAAARNPQPALPAARDSAESPSAMLTRLRAERQTGTDAAAQAALETRVQAWAQAWRLRDANELSAYYAPDFRGASASSAAWNAQLRRQLSGAKAQTDVEIEDLVTRDLGDGAVETRFLKTASTADGLDTTSVSLVWRQVNGQWRIVRERKT
jgi:ketosteroid isomerase-like protein